MSPGTANQIILALLNALRLVKLPSEIGDSYIQNRMEEKGLFSTHTMHELLDELDVIECFMEPGKAPIQGEVLKKQEQIYRDMEVAPLLAAGQGADA